MDRARTLAALYLSFDGPIDERLIQAALTGRPTQPWDTLISASRDLDRLALTTVQALARLRTLSRQRTAAATRLAMGLAFYRQLGVKTIARAAAVRAALTGG